MASRIEPSPRAARSPGRRRPAWRMTHTGVRRPCRPTGNPAAARMNGVGTLDLAVMQPWTLSGPLEYNDPLAGTGVRREAIRKPARLQPSRSDIEPRHPDRMTHQHPDLADEQADIDHAYECLESSRKAAWRLRDPREAGLGGTFQDR